MKELKLTIHRPSGDTLVTYLQDDAGHYRLGGDGSKVTRWPFPKGT